MDYKDWIIGLNRRNNSIKFYFLFEHYGMENLRRVIMETEYKTDELEKMVRGDEEIFEVFSRRFGILCFRVKGKDGRLNDGLTKKVIDQVKNSDEGFMSPGLFKGINLLRIVVGNYQSDSKTIAAYYKKIKEVAIK